MDKWTWTAQPEGKEERHTAEEWESWFSWPLAEESPEDRHLDAFKGTGKGKGKGKCGGKSKGKGYGRPPLVCNRCKGTGHPERECATPVGSTSTTKCGNCRGGGHWVSACTSLGNGKYRTCPQCSVARVAA